MLVVVVSAFFPEKVRPSAPFAHAPFSKWEKGPERLLMQVSFTWRLHHLPLVALLGYRWWKQNREDLKSLFPAGQIIFNKSIYIKMSGLRLPTGFFREAQVFQCPSFFLQGLNGMLFPQF